MTDPQQKLVLQSPRYGRGEPRYLFESKGAFRYDDWAPTLADLVVADTAEKQRDALSKAIFSTAAYYDGLRPASRSRLGVTGALSQELEARFRLESGKPVLTFACVYLGNTAIGYQTPDEERPDPAFAVVDGQAGFYHRVIRDPAESLGDVENSFNLNVVTVLANRLHDLYPGHEVIEKLHAEIEQRQVQPQ